MTSKRTSLEIGLQMQYIAIIAITEGSPCRTIVHGCEHLKNFILSDRGVKTDYDNDETDACMIAYLFQKVMDFKENKKSVHN